MKKFWLFIVYLIHSSNKFHWSVLRTDKYSKFIWKTWYILSLLVLIYVIAETTAIALTSNQYNFQQFFLHYKRAIHWNTWSYKLLLYFGLGFESENKINRKSSKDRIYSSPRQFIKHVIWYSFSSKTTFNLFNLFIFVPSEAYKASSSQNV